MNSMKTISRNFILAALLATLGGFLPLQGSSMLPSAHAAAGTAISGLPDFADLAEKTGPAVVNIRTTERVRFGQNGSGSDDEEMQEFFRRFFGIPMPR
jgi:serine protease Do